MDGSLCPLPRYAGSTARRAVEVDRRVDDRKVVSRLSKLAEGKAAIADQRLSAASWALGSLEQTPLQVGFAGRGCLALDEKAGHRQTLCPHSPYARCKAPRDSGQALPWLRTNSAWSGSPG